MSIVNNSIFADHQAKVILHMSNWRHKAKCAGVATNDFYSVDDSDMKKQAVKYCYSCPVQNQCLYTALVIDDRYGVWGGLTPRQRKSLVKKLKLLAESKNLDLNDWNTSVDNFIFEHTSLGTALSVLT